MTIFNIHKHKWQYLSKEFATIEKEIRSGAGMALGYRFESIKQEVTYIRSFCKRCGDIKAQTVEGRVSARDMQQMGYYQEETV